MEFRSVQPFISQLLRAANEVPRLTNAERARLLRRAATTIRDYRDKINFSDAPTNDSGPGDIVSELHAMARRIDVFSAHDVSGKILEAVDVMKTCRILLQTKREIEGEAGGSA
jgi:hypothetical protein